MSNTVLLIDVDSTIPNLALMKLSRYYKNLGYRIEFIKLGISFYPHKNKRVRPYVVDKKYHKVFASAIFNDNWKYVKGDNIEYGGSSYSLTKELDPIIDKLNPDYSIYDVDYTVDFITRGCVRNCYFCIVPKKEGKLFLYKDVNLIIKEAKERGHKKIMFLDNNILAYKGHRYILSSLIVSGLNVDLNQGLDYRRLDPINQNLLSLLKYEREYVFAYDDIKYTESINRKSELLNKFGKWNVKLYVYVNPNMNLSDTIERINYCKDNYYVPYIMRDIKCYDSEYSKFYTDLASYCNQPRMVKKLSFKEFLTLRHKNKGRIENSLNLWLSNGGKEDE